MDDCMYIINKNLKGKEMNRKIQSKIQTETVGVLLILFLIIIDFMVGIYIINTIIGKKPMESSQIESTNFKAGELLPCPCCGGVGELHNNTIDEREYYVECNGCGLHTDYYKGATEYDAKMVATRAWNMRCGSDGLNKVM